RRGPRGPATGWRGSSRRTAARPAPCPAPTGRGGPGAVPLASTGLQDRAVRQFVLIIRAMAVAWQRRQLYRAGRQVKPLVAAIRNGWQAAPIHDPRVVVQLEHDGGRGPVKKVQAALPPLPLEAESAYPAARDANQAIVAISKREENQIHQALGAAPQV